MAEETVLAIRLSIHIDAPPETVWRAFTTQEAWRGWFHEGVEIEPRLGGNFRIAGVHEKDPYVFVGRVVAFDPPSEFRVSWSPDPSRYEGESRVGFRLEPEGSGTRVELVHDGWENVPEPFRTREFQGFSRGWSVDDELARLKRLVEQDTRAWA